LSTNVIEPVGALPETLAVIVTNAPALDGLGDAAIVVVVAVGAGGGGTGGAAPPVPTCTVSALALADSTVTLMPYVVSLNVCPTGSVASLNDVVEGVMSSSSVSSLLLVHPEHIVSNG